LQIFYGRSVAGFKNKIRSHHRADAKTNLRLSGIKQITAKAMIGKIGRGGEADECRGNIKVAAGE